MRWYWVPIIATIIALVASGVAPGKKRSGPAKHECADLLIITARGSGQQTSPENSIVDKSIRAHFKGTIRSDQVRYPAASVTLAQDNIEEYLQGITEGAKDAREILRDHSQCPKERVIAVGYSSGALTIRRAMRRERTIDPKRFSAVLISDPGRIPDETTNMLGTAKRPAIGVSPAVWKFGPDRTANPLPESLHSRTISVCAAGDVVCDYRDGAIDSPKARAIHTSYIKKHQAWLKDAGHRAVLTVG